jgi:hypothetical protein
MPTSESAEHLAMSQRRFPSPWTIEVPDACFIVRQPEPPLRVSRKRAKPLVTRETALARRTRRVVAKFVRLPDVLGE